MYREKGKAGFSKPTVVDTAGGGGSIELAFDPTTHTPALSYFDSASGTIKLARKSGSSFDVNDVANVPPGTDPVPTLVFDAVTGKAKIVYFDSAAGGEFVAE